MADDQTKYCTNCKRDIAASNYLMHSAHCQRHIQLCTRCGEPVPVKSMKEHLDEFHHNICCTKCGKMMEKWMLEEHQEHYCSKRVQKCKFCELDCHMDDLEEHEVYCGSRTEPCEACGKLVMVKDNENHVKFECGLESNYETVEKKGAPLYEKSKLTARKENNNHLRLPMDLLHMPECDGFFSSPPKETNIKAHINSESDLPEKVLSKLLVSDFRPAFLDDGDNNGEDDQELQAALALSLMEVNDGVKQEEKLRSPSHRLDFSPTGNVRLPCEFCGELFQDDQLILHQTGCRSDFVQFRPPVTEETPLPSSEIEVPKDSVHNKPSLESSKSSASQNASSGDMEAWIQCEFCKELFPLDCLPLHEEFCSLLDKFPDVEKQGVSHSLKSDLKYFKPIDPAKESVRKKHQSPPRDYSVDDLPCEFCRKLFPLDKLLQHQNTCEKNSFISLGADKTYPVPLQVNSTETYEHTKKNIDGSTASKTYEKESIGTNPSKVALGNMGLEVRSKMPSNKEPRQETNKKHSPPKNKLKPEAVDCSKPKGPRNLGNFSTNQKNGKSRRKPIVEDGGNLRTRMQDDEFSANCNSAQDTDMRGIFLPHKGETELWNSPRTGYRSLPTDGIQGGEDRHLSSSGREPANHFRRRMPSDDPPFLGKDLGHSSSDVPAQDFSRRVPRSSFSREFPTKRYADIRKSYGNNGLQSLHCRLNPQPSQDASSHALPNRRHIAARVQDIDVSRVNAFTQADNPTDDDIELPVDSSLPHRSSRKNSSNATRRR